MHHTRRLLIVIPAMMALVPVVPATLTGLVSFDERLEVREELEEAIGSAAVEYRSRGGLQSSIERNETAFEKQRTEVQRLNRQKRALRLQLMKEHRILRTIELRTGASLETKADAVAARDAASERLSALLRERSAARLPGVRSIGWLEGLRWTVRDERLLQFQGRLVRDLTAAVSVIERRDAAVAERERILVLSLDAERLADKTSATIAVSKSQLERNKQIMADVHEQVLAIQSQLARIDARLREKSKRELVAKGLVDADDLEHAAASHPDFAWPVYGPVSAGFKNAAYVTFFGVQHYGADLVVPQGTPVGSAADGVVFLVRDGGATGYTYILIGHQGGYATLYGHLSETSVVAGQEVSAGQTIGLSGGKPGTKGAGPMTTAAHLHFEVIQGGVNVDPLSVLP